MRYSVFRSVHDSAPSACESWSDFLSQLSPVRVVERKDDVPLYSPAAYPEGVTRRTKANVLHISFGVLDIDEASEAKVVEALDVLDDLNIGYVVHTTHRHSLGLGSGLFKCRVIIPFSRPVEFDEWDRVWAGLFELTGSIADTACRNPNAIYYFPSCPPGAEGSAFVEVVEGDPADVDAILDEVQAAPSAESSIRAPDPEVLARIELSTRYQLAQDLIQRFPPAVSGQHGDTTTFRAAAIGADFALSEEEFWPLLIAYNQRCLPPWDEEDLQAKLEHATKYRKLPVGWRLADTGQTDRVSAADLSDLARRLSRREGRPGLRGRLLRSMLKGDAVSGDDAYTSMDSIGRLLAHHFESADPAHLASLLEDSLKASSKLDRDVNTAAFIECTRSEQQNIQLDRAQRRLEEQKIESLTLSDAFATVGVDRCTPYTESELKLFAEEALLSTPSEFKKRWVVRKGNTFYFFVGGQYIGPYTSEEALNAARSCLAPATLPMETMGQAGAMRPLRATEIVDRYGSVARFILADMTAQRSSYDSASQTLVEAPCPMLPIQAREVPEVDEWLLNLTGGGKPYEKILDWLSCLSNIEHPCAALFLFGARGTGKSLIAHACSRLWTDAGPTEIDDITGSFNQALAECPLVFADETVPEDHRGEPRTDMLRKLIQDHTRTFKRKFIADSKLKGSIRMVLAANSPDLIVSNRKALTNHDIEAINERFLCIDAKMEAKDYLVGLIQDKPEIARSITHGTAIVEHALWLYKTRTVDYGHRLLVEGEPGSELEMRMLTGSGLRSEVCHWISGFIINPRRISGEGRRPVIDNKDTPELLVTAKILHQHWLIYCDQKPSVGAIEKALGGVSNGRREFGHEKYRRIDLNRVRYWASANGVASEATFDRAFKALVDFRVVEGEGSASA